MVLAIVCVTGLRVAKEMQSNLVALADHKRNLDWEIAQGLQQMNIHQGDRVSHISGVHDVEWVRLAGVTIISGIPFGEQGPFWAADAQMKQKLFAVLAGTGAKVVVTSDPPPSAVSQGWVRLGDTTYYAHRLS
jgi:hypothetical protein